MTELTAEMIQRGRGADPEEIARRRRANLEVRAAREKLTSSTGLERSFDYDLLRTFAQQHSGATLALFVLVAFVGGAATLWVPIEPIAIWMVVVISATSIMATLSRRFQKQPQDDVNIRSWRRRFILAATLEGSSWGMFVFVLLSSNTPSVPVFVLFVLLMVAAVQTMLSATIPNAVYSAIVPLGLALLGMLVPGRSIDELTIAVMGCSALFYFVLLARRLHANAVTSLEFRAQKDALFVELEVAKANSDRARGRAEEANLAKSRFLATMSHELRTPLNAILGFSEVMKNELFGPHASPAYKEYADDIHGSGQHLLNLINEILDLSRIEAGKYELNEEAVSIAYIVEECAHMLGLRAKAKGQTVRELVEPNLPRLWADERAVRQIVLNILSNAIKFTPQGGEITVKAGWTASGGQYVSVKDTGPGIPEDETATVLASFGRGTLAIKTAEQGSGLGLPIVKGLVDLHGGNFQLKSQVRVGTEVIVTFPSSRVVDALAAMPEPETRAQPAPRQSAA